MLEVGAGADGGGTNGNGGGFGSWNWGWEITMPARSTAAGRVLNMPVQQSRFVLAELRETICVVTGASNCGIGKRWRVGDVSIGCHVDRTRPPPPVHLLDADHVRS